MEEKSVSKEVFDWVLKGFSAILTFMIGILIYLHRKLHFMDKTLAINEERDQQTQKDLTEIKGNIKDIKKVQRTILDKFNDYDKQYNDIVLDRNQMAEMVREQTQVMSDYKIKFIDPKQQKKRNA